MSNVRDLQNMVCLVDELWVKEMVTSVTSGAFLLNLMLLCYTTPKL